MLQLRFLRPPELLKQQTWVQELIQTLCVTHALYSIAQRKATNSTLVLQSIHHQIVGTCSTEYQPNQNIRMTYIRNYPNLNSNYEPRVGRTKTLPVASHVAVLQKRWMVLSTQHLHHNIPNLESFTSSTTSSTQTVSDTSFQPLIFPSICVESALMDKPQEQNPLGPLQYLSSLVDKCMESRTELARTFKSWTKMDIVKKTWNNLKKQYVLTTDSAPTWWEAKVSAFPLNAREFLFEMCLSTREIVTMHNARRVAAWYGMSDKQKQHRKGEVECNNLGNALRSSEIQVSVARTQPAPSHPPSRLCNQGAKSDDGRFQTWASKIVQGSPWLGIRSKKNNDQKVSCKLQVCFRFLTSKKLFTKPLQGIEFHWNHNWHLLLASFHHPPAN